MLKFYFIVFLAFANYTIRAQFGKLESGPMCGNITTQKASVWLMVKNTKTVQISVIDSALNESVITQLKQTDSISNHKGYCPLIFSFEGLKSNIVYYVQITIDSKLLLKKERIKTMKETDVNDFSFLTGLCAMMLPRFTGHFARVSTD